MFNWTITFIFIIYTVRRFVLISKYCPQHFIFSFFNFTFLLQISYQHFKATQNKYQHYCCFWKVITKAAHLYRLIATFCDFSPPLHSPSTNTSYFRPKHITFEVIFTHSFCKGLVRILVTCHVGIFISKPISILTYLFLPYLLTYSME